MHKYTDETLQTYKRHPYMAAPINFWSFWPKDKYYIYIFWMYWTEQKCKPFNFKLRVFLRQIPNNTFWKGTDLSSPSTTVYSFVYLQMILGYFVHSKVHNKRNKFVSSNSIVYELVARKDGFGYTLPTRIAERSTYLITSIKRQFIYSNSVNW